MSVVLVKTKFLKTEEVVIPIPNAENDKVSDITLGVGVGRLCVRVWL